MIKRTLYFGNPAYLSLRNSQLVLRLPEVETSSAVSDKFKREAERTFPIEDLGVVILDNRRITITQGLLERLMDNNCAVISCDSTHMPTGLFLPLDELSTDVKRELLSMPTIEVSCIISTKVQNLKAIHNSCVAWNAALYAV